MRCLLTINFLLFTIPAYSAQFQCFKSGRIRIVKDKQNRPSPKSFCINHSTYDIVSFSCIRNNNCQAIKNYKNHKKIQVGQKIMGNPHQKRCSSLGGNPQLIEYHDGNSWVGSAICHFKDLSFISLFNTI